ncbi:MAG: hypothetical protein ACK4FB_07985 [Brevundimonas sp.]|uniref:hypothetical protein n=1 Tax=Brevundimonas sp. TaxID=1871086 RepID=UPI00391AC203
MNPKRHAKLARDLIDACGGLDEAAHNCRVGKSSLSDYQLPQISTTMPADVIADLEAYCGEPIYSRELAAARPYAPMGGCPVKETHDVVQSAAALLPLADDLKAGRPGALDAFLNGIANLKSEARECHAVAANEDSNVTKLGRA